MSLTLTPATRLANFRRVVAERGLTPQSLAQRLGSRYSYWRDLLAGQKSFGEKAARRIEEWLDLPRGWLDQIYGWENELDEGRKARQALASRLGIPSEPTKENEMKIDPSTFDDKISTPEGFMAWQTAIEAEMERSYLDGSDLQHRNNEHHADRG